MPESRSGGEGTEEVVIISVQTFLHMDRADDGHPLPPRTQPRSGHQEPFFLSSHGGLGWGVEVMVLLFLCSRDGSCKRNIMKK